MRTVTEFPYSTRVIENTWIPMPDGCRLAARIILPDDAEENPVPAILEYIPYRKRDYTAVRDHGPLVTWPRDFVAPMPLYERRAACMEKSTIGCRVLPRFPR